MSLTCACDILTFLSGDEDINKFIWVVPGSASAGPGVHAGHDRQGSRC